MTTRRDVERLSGAARTISELAVVELESLFLSLDRSSPEAIRDALLEVVPDLVNVFGEMSATAAAEWYEQVRSREYGGRFNATLGAGADPAAVAGSVRAAAGGLFGDDPMAALGVLAGAVQRHVTYSSRSTVARNVQLDPAKPRYARVPRGPKSCAWCVMLASRGFVYTSRKSAGIDSGHFHDDCDCAIVVEFDQHESHITGYDPDKLYDMYQAARQETGKPTPSQKEIAAVMRRLYPDELKDGVTPPV